MKFYSTILVLAVLLSAFVYEASAQKTPRKKTTRRTNATSARTPTINSAQIIEPAVISTAETENEENNNRIVVDPSTSRRETKNNKQNADAENKSATQYNDVLQREVSDLRREVKNLRERRGVDDLEKLSVAEERAENFRRKLDETIARESALNSRLQELEIQSQPEAIQRETAVIGSTRPEDIREARRKQLEGEKTRVREQLNQVQISRARLEAAIANADSLVEKLRSRVEAELDTTETKKVQSKDSEQNNSEPPIEEPNPQF
jgi:hypothetical protein